MPSSLDVWKRITLVWPHKGNHHYSHAISRALRRMGYIVDMVDYREHRDGLHELFRRINADLVIVGRGEGIPPGLIASLRCPTVLWYGEYIAGKDEYAITHLRELQYNASAFDYVIWLGDKDSDSIRILRNLGCSRVGYVYPCRYDPEVYKKLYLPKIYDVSFVGSITPRRDKILSTLAKKFKVEVRNIWDVEEQVRFFNQSKIVLHINFAQFIATRSVNMRTFDVLGSGSFMLHEDVLFHTPFQDGRHLSFWKFGDVNDLCRKIDYYLTNDTERERIAEEGYAFVKRSFSVDETIRQLLGQIDFSIHAPALNMKGCGIAFDKWGRETTSMNELHKALEPILSPQYVQSYFEQGKMYYELERWEEAAAFFEKAVEREATFVNAMYFLALTYVHLLRVNDAIRELKHLLEVAPFHAEANLALGELYSGTGDIELAEYYKQKGRKVGINGVH